MLITFMYNGKERYKTFIGGIVTLLMWILILAYFGYSIDRAY